MTRTDIRVWTAANRGPVILSRNSLTPGASTLLTGTLGDETGIHDSFSGYIELMELVSAGLTPSQAIVAAT